jgi:putative redox protein
MKARIRWIEDRTFIGESGSGHNIMLGTAYGHGGKTPGPSPMEMVLIGTGGCSAFDVVHILEKGREAIEDCIVELDAERAEKTRRCSRASTALRGQGPWPRPGQGAACH